MTKDDLLNLDVSPFTRLVWNSESARRKYEPLMATVASLHDTAEYEMVRQGKRKCGTLHLAPHNFHRIIEKLKKDGMVWLPIQWSRNYTGFSHYHLPTVEGDPESSCYGVMARDIEDAELFRTASAYEGRGGGKVDHEIIGELLGFPACCTKFFVEEWANGYYDPVWQSALKTEGNICSDKLMEVEGHIHTNQMLRYYGLRTTSHFPCRMDCKESIEVGKDWLEVMRSIDTHLTDSLIEFLEMSLVWSCLHGLAVVETPVFTLITNSLPTKERWSVLYNSKGKQKPEEVLTLLGEDINFDHLTDVMMEQLQKP